MFIVYSNRKLIRITYIWREWEYNW